MGAGTSAGDAAPAQGSASEGGASEEDDTAKTGAAGPGTPPRARARASADAAPASRSGDRKAAGERADGAEAGPAGAGTDSAAPTADPDSPEHGAAAREAGEDPDAAAPDAAAPGPGSSEPNGEAERAARPAGTRTNGPGPAAAGPNGSGPAAGSGGAGSDGSEFTGLSDGPEAGQAGANGSGPHGSRPAVHSPNGSGPNGSGPNGSGPEGSGPEDTKTGVAGPGRATADSGVRQDTADRPEDTAIRLDASGLNPVTETQDTAPPEGSGRAAPRDAPAPVRQWPLVCVLGLTGLGLAVVGTHPFAEAFRIGSILIGIALMLGAVLRRLIPSVGMLAVRSRFTDMVTYGVLGVVIVLLALMTQPRPWLEIPFLEDVVHSTVP